MPEVTIMDNDGNPIENALTTPQSSWAALQQASSQSSIYNPTLAYSGTWATGAQNPAVWPTSAVALKADCNGIRCRFALSAAQNKEALATLWGKDANGAPIPLVVFSVLRAGPAVVEADPVSAAVLADYLYVDYITVGTAHIGKPVVKNISNGIAEVRLDVQGVSSLFLDWVADGTSGARCAGGLGWFKYY